MSAGNEKAEESDEERRRMVNPAEMWGNEKERKLN